MREGLSSNCSLEELSLMGNMLGDDGVHIVCECLFNKNIRRLNVALNEITSNGCAAIGNLLKINTLR